MTPGTALPETARAILAEAEAFDGTPPVSDQALIGAAQGRRELIYTDDAVGVIGEGELDLVVRPTARGRGVGRTLLRSLLHNATQRCAGSTDSATEPATEPAPELRAWAHGNKAAACALLAEAGFTPKRELLRMTLDPARLSTAIDQARAWPEQISLTAFTPEDDAQADELVRVNAAAFADHPEQGALSRDDFTLLQHEPWFNADDLLLAYLPRDHTGAAAPQPAHRNRLAGFAWIKTTRTTAGGDATSDTVETELYVLGVAPDVAGKGIGSALLGAALRRMATHSPDRICLYVDADNTGAIVIYTRAGFEIEQRSTQFVLRSSPGYRGRME